MSMRWANLPEFESPPLGWRLVLLRCQADFVFGQSPDSQHYNQRGDGLPFLQGNADFSDDHPNASVFTTVAGKECLAQDTLISVRAPVGELSRADRVYALGRGVAALRPRTMNSTYFYYAMYRWRRPLLRAAQGSTFDAVIGRHFFQLRCLFPTDATEQARIAETLKAADDHIRALEGHIRKAERLAIALEQTHFLPSHDAVRFPYEYGTERTIPAGWKPKALGCVADVTSGVTLNEDREPAENRVRYLTVVNVYRGRIDLTEERYLESRGNEAETKRLNVNDILVVEGHANPAEIGRAALVTEKEAGMSFQNHLFRVRLPNQDEMRARFLARVLNSTRVRRNWVATAKTSSGLSTINRTALRRLVIPVPAPHEQDRIVAKMDAAESNIAALNSQLTAARRLKQSLLQNLLTGKVRLKP